jgi:hypothetical protein
VSGGYGGEALQPGGGHMLLQPGKAREQVRRQAGSGRPRQASRAWLASFPALASRTLQAVGTLGTRSALRTLQAALSLGAAFAGHASLALGAC